MRFAPSMVASLVDALHSLSCLSSGSTIIVRNEAGISPDHVANSREMGGSDMLRRIIHALRFLQWPIRRFFLGDGV